MLLEILKKKVIISFFEGKIYDAYSLLVNILNKSKTITIIDNYLDKKILDICAKTNKDVEIITKEQNQIDIEKYKKQYSNINIKNSNSFHDIFIFIDDEYLYHCGASFKDLGKKCFAKNRIEDEEFIEQLKNKIKRTYIK